MPCRKLWGLCHGPRKFTKILELSIRVRTLFFRAEPVGTGLCSAGGTTRTKHTSATTATRGEANAHSADLTTKKEVFSNVWASNRTRVQQARSQINGTEFNVLRPSTGRQGKVLSGQVEASYKGQLDYKRSSGIQNSLSTSNSAGSLCLQAGGQDHIRGDTVSFKERSHPKVFTTPSHTNRQ